MAVSIAAIGIKGLNFGIDFKGGTQINFRTPQPTALEEVRGEAAKVGQAGAVIQGRGQSVDGRYTNFQIRTESLSSEEQNVLQQEPRGRCRCDRVRREERLRELRPPDSE